MKNCKYYTVETPLLMLNIKLENKKIKIKNKENRYNEILVFGDDILYIHFLKKTTFANKQGKICKFPANSILVLSPDDCIITSNRRDVK